MHTPSIQARLEGNKRAWTHFQRFKLVYIRYAQSVRDWAKAFPELSLESRAFMVKRLIMELDVNIYGLASVTPPMSAEEVAECIAKLVVGHEN